MNAYRIPNHDGYLLAGSYDDSPTPSPGHFAEALNTLVDDADRLAEFLAEQPANALARVFQLYHHRGLPKRDNSARDNALVEQYADVFDALLVGYRDALGDTLDDAARKAMEADDARARLDAAEAGSDA